MRLFSLALLNAVPNKALGLHLKDQEYIAGVKYRLGLPVYPVAGPCVVCHRPSNQFGDHSIG